MAGRIGDHDLVPEVVVPAEPDEDAIYWDAVAVHVHSTQRPCNATFLAASRVLPRLRGNGRAAAHECAMSPTGTKVGRSEQTAGAIRRC